MMKAELKIIQAGLSPRDLQNFTKKASKEFEIQSTATHTENV